MQEAMLWLSDNTILGMSVASVLVIALYLAISIPTYIKAQRKGYDVSFGAFIPFVNIFFLIKACLKK